MKKLVLFFEDQPDVAERLIDILKSKLNDSRVDYATINYKDNAGGLREADRIAEEGAMHILEKKAPTLLMVDRCGEPGVGEDEDGSYIGLEVVKNLTQLLTQSGKVPDLLNSKEFTVVMVTGYNISAKKASALLGFQTKVILISEANYENVLNGVRGKPNANPVLPYFGKSSNDNLKAKFVKDWAATLDRLFAQ
jgi:hypothetical protein